MKYLLGLTGLLLWSCADNSPLKELGDLEKEEISGIEIPAGSDIMWAIEDHGNPEKLYGIDAAGKISRQIVLTNVKNNDWEDITSDTQGNLYIGDFGNNDNDRKNLAIYKIDGAELDAEKAMSTAVTTFYYPDQKDFPPKKSGRFYDVEAFYEHNGNFFLFTKNRSSRFNGDLTVYKVPNRPGNFAATKIGSLNTCGKYNQCAVAGADISPDGKMMVLLAADRLWLVTGFTDASFTNATMELHELDHNTQKEGICFKDNDTLLITDEKEDNTGGKLYSVKISELKGETKPE